MTDLAAAAWAGEELLLSPAVRADRSRLEPLLSADFTEIGQSGRWWGREEILAELTGESLPPGPATLTERAAREVGPGTLLLTYRLDLGTGASRRSSLWCEEDGAVRCVFHQGTPLPG
ncbi:nuclear transport factor 2 family protein [Georgenia wutianyii]|uniref:Nuclear transport factor 2 family protein n=1 Tax=Georgenia wutianyii TaxID=2585135 RepID=A0ABX5VN60_9MICO|nr:DUF4440 domain-containing protein [Georgenia wutianyii]QDB79944.1 nuclear transport factor 2 family protein [Georgenia wutianyii]